MKVSRFNNQQETRTEATRRHRRHSRALIKMARRLVSTGGYDDDLRLAMATASKRFGKNVRRSAGIIVV